MAPLSHAGKHQWHLIPHDGSNELIISLFSNVPVKNVLKSNNCFGSNQQYAEAFHYPLNIVWTYVMLQPKESYLLKCDYTKYMNKVSWCYWNDLSITIRFQITDLYFYYTETEYLKIGWKYIFFISLEKINCWVNKNIIISIFLQVSVNTNFVNTEGYTVFAIKYI